MILVMNMFFMSDTAEQLLLQQRVQPLLLAARARLSVHGKCLLDLTAASCVASRCTSAM